MKRPVEEQMQLPVLAVAYNPLDPNVVIAELSWDWRRTGEVHLVYITRESLENCRQALHFLENFIADELWFIDDQEGKHGPKEKEDKNDGLPF